MCGMSNAIIERLAEVLAERRITATSFEGVSCRMVRDWHSWSEHDAHVAQALADALADHDRSVQVAALRNLDGGEEASPPSIADTCCGECSGGTCYVDGVTEA
jgi:hypothetical protein